MPEFIVIKKQLIQLEEVVNGPIAQLDTGNQAATRLKVTEFLSESAHCCVVVPANAGNNKLKNIITLYKGMIALKNIQRQLCKQHSLVTACLIGIYPSLEYPACVFELHTNAENYVSGNVLPHTGSALIGTIKYLIGKLLGANPAVGALGLILYRE
jgi:hypothetical protein